MDTKQANKTPQDKVRDLLESAEDRSKLNRWVLGYIPKHYKRISCDMNTALELAKLGVTESLTLFDTPLFLLNLLYLALRSVEDTEKYL